jgi:tetratricopeptide (TPR) repeat protein
VRVVWAVLPGILLAASLVAETSKSVPVQEGLAEVNAALQAGQADRALTLLSSLPSPAGNSAEAHNLRCRVFFILEQFEEAKNECAQAVTLDPQNSRYHLWFGRSLGEVADRANFLTAYSLAKRARAEFEQAVQLSPSDAEALADLGEFYSSAPGVVGGGMDKAADVAAQLDGVDPARAHELRAAIAHENRDMPGAERELKEAVRASAHPAFQWMRLASFYRKAKRYSEMEDAVHSGWTAAQRDSSAAVALFNGASVLIQGNRNPALAIRLLEAYLASPSATEEAPAFTARVWLARLRAQTGDPEGARREKSEALALAQEYKPAQDLKL